MNAALVPPFAHDLDKHAKEYLALKESYLQATLAAKAAGELLEKKGDELKQLVTEFGSAHAEKSKILHGVGYELVVTYGSSVVIDGQALEKFRLGLVAAKQARLLKRIFDKTIRWTLSPNAAAIIRGEQKLSKPLLALYAQCEVVKPRTPLLQVREK